MRFFGISWVKNINESGDCYHAILRLEGRFNKNKSKQSYFIFVVKCLYLEKLYGLLSYS